MDFGAWIRAARDHADMTQAGLGEVLGVTKGNVSAWELGRHEPSVRQLLAIAEATRYPLTKLSEQLEPLTLPSDAARLVRAFKDIPEGHPARGNVVTYAEAARDTVRASGELRSEQANRGPASQRAA